jgi:hypothetical protein
VLPVCQEAHNIYKDSHLASFQVSPRLYRGKCGVSAPTHQKVRSQLLAQLCCNTARHHAVTTACPLCAQGRGGHLAVRSSNSRMKFPDGDLHSEIKHCKAAQSRQSPCDTTSLKPPFESSTKRGGSYPQVSDSRRRRTTHRCGEIDRPPRSSRCNIDHDHVPT